jgi:hypothetical protein
MWKSFVAMSCALLLGSLAAAPSKAADGCACGPGTVMMSAPAGATAMTPTRSYSVAPGAVAPGRSYSYAPSAYAPSSYPAGFTAYEDNAARAYSNMAAVRPGQTMFTYGLRPAAAKALGNY